MDGSTLRKFATDFLAFAEVLLIPSARGVRRFGDVMADFQRQWFQDVAPALVALARGQTRDIGRYFTAPSLHSSRPAATPTLLRRESNPQSFHYEYHAPCSSRYPRL